MKENFDPHQVVISREYFDKLIEIACCNGKELDTLQQGVALVLRLFQHTPVKAKPTFVAIEETVRCRCRVRSTWHKKYQPISSFDTV